MTVHSGFYNSYNGDRIYDAEDFSRFFDGIIFDGVYSAVGNRFYVEPGADLTVTVDTGRAWFNHTWIFNDQKLALALENADTVYDRIDAVVIEINREQRKNFLKIVKGEASQMPSRPVMEHSDNIDQYAIAYVTVEANAETLTQSDITYVVDTSETPLCSALNLVGLPSGGDVGQVLAKKSSTSGDVGWYSVKQLPTEDWLHPNGVTDSDIIAAYKFAGAESEAKALQNINNSETNYYLEKSSSYVTWSTADGFLIPARNGAGLKSINNALNNLQIGTAAIKIASATTGKLSMGLITKSAGYSMFLSLYNHVHRKTTQEFHQIWGENKRGVFHGGRWYYTNGISSVTDGILSCNFLDKQLAYNGKMTALASNEGNVVTNGNHFTTPNIFGHVSDDGDNKNYGSYYIRAAILFNRTLSNDELFQLHGSMEMMP